MWVPIGPDSGRSAVSALLDFLMSDRAWLYGKAHRAGQKRRNESTGMLVKVC